MNQQRLIKNKPKETEEVMKQLIVIIFSVCLIMAPGASIAKKSGKGRGKGHSPTPNDSAYEHAADSAKFKRGNGWQGGW